LPRKYDSLRAKIASSITNLDRTKILTEATKRSREARRTQLAGLANSDVFLSEIKELKKDSLSRLDSLIETFVSNCKGNGAKVIIARTGDDVVSYLLELAERNDVKLIDKSKSLTTEEIELNHYLEEKGLDVVETDLGERIIQLAHEKTLPSRFPGGSQIAERNC
jgi:L-lactate dehydrogenase complex protein LldF